MALTWQGKESILDQLNRELMGWMSKVIAFCPYLLHSLSFFLLSVCMSKLGKSCMLFLTYSPYWFGSLFYQDKNAKFIPIDTKKPYQACTEMNQLLWSVGLSLNEQFVMTSLSEEFHPYLLVKNLGTACYFLRVSYLSALNQSFRTLLVSSNWI